MSIVPIQAGWLVALVVLVALAPAHADDSIREVGDERTELLVKQKDLEARLRNSHAIRTDNSAKSKSLEVEEDKYAERVRERSAYCQGTFEEAEFSRRKAKCAEDDAQLKSLWQQLAGRRKTLDDFESSRAREFTAMRDQYLQVQARLKAMGDPKCDVIAGQLQRDQRTMKHQGESIREGLEELDEWTKASEKAQMDAIMEGGKLLMGGMVEKLKDQANAAAGFKGWMTRYKKQIEEGKVPFEALQSKIEIAARGYVNASIQASGGRMIKAGQTSKDAWDLLKSEAGAVAQEKAKSDARMRDALENEKLKKFLETNKDGVELKMTLFTLAAQSKELEKLIGPESELASFVVNYGYDSKAWLESRKRILQHARLTEQELKAVDSLKKQIERTAHRLQQCRS